MKSSEMQVLLIVIISLCAVPHLVNSDCPGIIVIRETQYAHNEEEYGTIPPNIMSNSEVIFCNQTIELTELVQYEGMTDITITGFPTVIKCRDNLEAGLNFRNIQSLTISGITIFNCGHCFSAFDETNTSMRVGISISNCTNVHITDLTISESTGTGLALLDNYGSVLVVNSSFERNGRDKSSGGNGVYIEASQRTAEQGVNYQLTQCTFTNNSASTGKAVLTPEFNRFDKGGGVCIFIRSKGVVTIEIENATISGNVAGSYGGGTYAAFRNNASHSWVIIKDSKYTNNSARYGGGHYTGYQHNREGDLKPINCSSIFQNNDFIDNKASYGGGVSVFSTRSDSLGGTVNFEKCTWRLNSGQFGSAIAILPNAWDLHTEGYLPKISISNCVIEGNSVTQKLEHNDRLIQQYTLGYGALYCSSHRLTFNAFNRFSHNNGTAVYMGLCTATFSNESQTTFSFNKGYFGGAMYLMSSVLYLSDDTALIFKNNIAYSKGGAIYYNSFTFHVYDYSRTCFLTFAKRDGRKAGERNITVLFKNNTAGTNSRESAGYGHSIFADSLYPCYKQFNFPTAKVVPFSLFRELLEISLIHFQIKIIS